MKKIESPITAMVNMYIEKLEMLNRLHINNLSNTDNVKELILELKGMKQILEVSGLIKFFSDGSCDIITLNN